MTIEQYPACGQIIGHGERCSIGWLCDDCKEKSQIAEQERKRITDIIRDRIDVINNAVDVCARSYIPVPQVMLAAQNELYVLLREIEKEQNT